MSEKNNFARIRQMLIKPNILQVVKPETEARLY